MSTIHIDSGRILLKGTWIRYSLVRSPRRRRLLVRVTSSGGLEVKAPRDLSFRAVEALLLSETDWLAAALETANRRRPLAPSSATTGQTLPLLDERLRLVVTPACAPSAHRSGDELWLHSPSAAPEAVEPLLESWYRHQAWLYLPPRLRQLAQPLNVQPSRISIRSQKTRWGSCSAYGTISLNWRLMLLPSVLADYVLVHELCHLRHLDHSPRFWELLSTLVPDYQEHRSALRKATASLPF